MREAPAHFRGTPENVRFYDLTGLIPAGKKNWCGLEFKLVQPLSTVYQPQHIVRKRGLPVLAALPLIVDVARDYLGDHGSVATSGVPKKRVKRLTNTLLVA